MISRISFHEDARSEFDEAVAFYAMESSALGVAFVEAVERGLAHARQHPESAVLLRGQVCSQEYVA